MGKLKDQRFHLHHLLAFIAGNMLIFVSVDFLPHFALFLPRPSTVDRATRVLHASLGDAPSFCWIGKKYLLHVRVVA